MSLHTYSRCRLHLIWATIERRPLLHKPASKRVSLSLQDYAQEKEVYMKINYVNADHVHALIDLPTHLSIEKTVQLLKGSSSNWVNSNDVIPTKFAWGRGYGVFSVSESLLPVVSRYIARQEEHHRVRSFKEELKEIIERHGLEWREEKPLKRLESLTC